MDIRDIKDKYDLIEITKKHFSKNIACNYQKLKFNANDLMALLLLSSAIYTINYFIIITNLHKDLFSNYPTELGLMISSSSLVLGKYEGVFKIIPPYTSIICSSMLSIMFTPITIHERVLNIRPELFFIAIFALIEISIFENSYSTFIIFFILIFCIAAAQISPNIIISFTLINAIILTSFTFYLVASEKNR